jgi:hypothetical protein
MFDAADEEVTRYRALSALAVVALLAGLLSPLAMFAAMFWLVPLAAVVLSGLALWRVATCSADLVGHRAAFVGLMLGAAFLVAAPVDDLVYRYCLRRQARQFAEIWIDAVRHGEVYKAHHLMIDPKRRQPLEDKLADFYLHNENSRRMLNGFVKEPAVRTLFALGTTAEIRFYDTAAEFHEEGYDFVQQTYAVTYPDERKRPKSFFINLLAQRSVDAGSGRAGWTLKRVDGGVQPPGW